ncbi:MAG TPA: hypothetical protein VNJ01_12955 [Bacteriovoracaceae bacterium]|nr:hypothetical protein [Bacteriovoracaceae bacterium]
MEKMIELFEEFLMKSITMTEAVLEKDVVPDDGLTAFTQNRERLLAIVDQISQQISWNEVSQEKRSDLNRQIDYVKKLDEKLLVKLQEYQAEVKKDIEKTFRQKEGFKGYNLNDVK